MMRSRACDYVVAELRQRPSASYQDIARRLGAKESYVRGVARRFGLERVGTHAPVITAVWPPKRSSQR